MKIIYVNISEIMTVPHLAVEFCYNKVSRTLLPRMQWRALATWYVEISKSRVNAISIVRHLLLSYDFENDIND